MMNLIRVHEVLVPNIASSSLILRHRRRDVDVMYFKF